MFEQIILKEVADVSAELEKWLREERQAGFEEGFKEAREEDENCLITLLKMLKSDGRLQDWDLAIDNEAVREKLYQEYHIE